MKKLVVFLLVAATIAVSAVAMAQSNDSTKADNASVEEDSGVMVAPPNSPEAERLGLSIALFGGGGKYADTAVGGGGLDLAIWVKATQYFGIVPKFEALFLSSADCQLSLALLFAGRTYGDRFRGGGGLALVALVSMAGAEDPAQEIEVPPADGTTIINSTPLKNKVGVWRGTGFGIPVFLELKLDDDFPVWFVVQETTDILSNQFSGWSVGFLVGGGVRIGWF